MSGVPCGGSGPSRGGFTLIEVIGALVIFSLGVIMVLQLSESLSARMQYASRTGEIVARAQERLDSLETLPFDSLALGSHVDTVTVQGVRYLLTASVTAVTGVLYQIDVTAVPSVAGKGPTFTTTSYQAAAW